MTHSPHCTLQGHLRRLQTFQSKSLMVGAAIGTSKEERFGDEVLGWAPLMEVFEQSLELRQRRRAALRYNGKGLEDGAEVAAIDRRAARHYAGGTMRAPERVPEGSSGAPRRSG